MSAAPRPHGSRSTYPLRVRAYDLGLSARFLPFETLAPSGVLSWTCWVGGCYTRRPGVRVDGDLERLARGLDGYAQLVVEKGTGAQIAMAVTRDGRRTEDTCEAVTGLALDSDVGLDPAPLMAVLDAAGVAYILQTSSSSTPAWPKWHLILPLTAITPPNKFAWQARFAHTIGFLEGAAGLPGPRAIEAPAAAPEGTAGFVARHGRGLDPCTDGLVQMSFMPARRTAMQSPPQLVNHHGLAIDLDKLLVTTGYDAELARSVWESEHGARAHEHDPRAHEHGARAHADEKLVCEPAPELLPVLARAFAAAGWLGSWSRGAWVARCPWWRQHPATSHGATEWSARLFLRPAPTWWCRHCTGRRQSEVRAALPSAAWTQARAAPPARTQLMASDQGAPGAERLGVVGGHGSSSGAGRATRPL